jgi:hypothetical protein
VLDRVAAGTPGSTHTLSVVIYCLKPIFTVNRDLSEEGKGRTVVKEPTPPQAASPQPHETAQS